MLPQNMFQELIIPSSLNFGILPSALVSRRAEPDVFLSTTPSATFNRCDTENSPIFFSSMLKSILFVRSLCLQVDSQTDFETDFDTSVHFHISENRTKMRVNHQIYEFVRATGGSSEETNKFRWKKRNPMMATGFRSDSRLIRLAADLFWISLLHRFHGINRGDKPNNV